VRPQRPRPGWGRLLSIRLLSIRLLSIRLPWIRRLPFPPPARLKTLPLLRAMAQAPPVAASQGKSCEKYYSACPWAAPFNDVKW